MLLKFPIRTFIHPPIFVQSRSLSLVPRMTMRAIKESLDKPKKHPSAYNLFFQEKYGGLKIPNFGVVDIARRLGASWNNLSPVEKQKYTDRAIKLGEQSRIDMAAYQQTLTPRQKLARKVLYYHTQYSRGLVTRGEIPKEVKEFVKGLPASPFVTGRAMFIASKLRGHRNPINLLPLVNAQWERLPSQEKKTFEERSASDIQSFKENVGKYIKV